MRREPLVMTFLGSFESIFTRVPEGKPEVASVRARPVPLGFVGSSASPAVSRAERGPKKPVNPGEAEYISTC